MSSIHLGSKKKTTTSTTSTSTPLDQYSPYISGALGSAQQAFNDNQPNMAGIGSKALDVFNGLGGATSTASSIANGTNPAQASYGLLTRAGANDPSMGILKGLATDDYTNPATGLLTGMASSGGNPLTGGVYGRMTSSDYSTANPFVDAIAKHGEDAALKAVNQRFAASGIGEGMSTPYADLASRNVADAGNQIRYQNYNDAENRALGAAGQSDSEYNTTAARNLAAAQALGSTAQGDRSNQLAAAQALGGQNSANNATSLSATKDNVDSILQALGLSGQLSGDQLGALGASATLPMAGASSLADIISGLTGKYGTNTGTGTTTENNRPGLFDWMQMFGQNAAAAAKAAG